MDTFGLSTYRVFDVSTGTPINGTMRLEKGGG